MRKSFFTLFAAFILLTPLAAQDLETGYFLGGNPYAFRLNPAFQSERNIISVALGMTGASVQSNLGISTLFYPDPASNKVYSFLNNHVSASQFLRKLHRNNYLDADAQVNLATAGFWIQDHFFTVDFNVRSMDAVSLPYDLFRFLKGEKSEGSVYQFGNLGVNTITFGEAAFGWSHRFDGGFSLGARTKFLVGAEEAHMTLDKLQVSIQDNSWSIESYGSLVASSPALEVPQVEGGGNLNFSKVSVDWSKFAPAGWGAAFDVGFSWDILPFLTVSGSILDLGAVCWNHEVVYQTPDKTYKYAPQERSDAEGANMEVMELLGAAANILNWREVPGARPGFEMLPFRLLAGTEFRMPFYDRLSLGLLYQGRFIDSFDRHVGRVSLNWNPLDFLSLSTSTSFSHFGESMGFALNLHPVGVNLLLGCDYIPLCYVDATPLLRDIPEDQVGFAVLPRGPVKMNFYIGLNVAFGHRRLDYKRNYL